jgi:hypothetical protein
MKFPLKTAASAIAVTMVLGGASAAFAKAHDQGVADGEPFPSNTGAFVQTLESGVSSLQNDGQRGDTASGNGGDNRVEPVVGANEPD